MAVVHTMSRHLQDQLQELEKEHIQEKAAIPLVIAAGILVQWLVLGPQALQALACLAESFLLLIVFFAFSLMDLVLCIGAMVYGFVMIGPEFPVSRAMSIWTSCPPAAVLETVPADFLLKSFWPALVFGTLALLLWLTPQDSQQQRQQTMGILKAGIQGEDTVEAVLQRLPREYQVLRNLRLDWGGTTTETDFVIVGPTGVFVAEVKALSGKVSGSAADPRLIHETRYKRRQIPSPFRQVHRHVMQTASLLRSRGCSVWVQGIVVFAGEASVHIHSHGDTPHFHRGSLDQLQRYIQTCPSQRRLSVWQQQNILTVLKQHSQE